MANTEKPIIFISNGNRFRGSSLFNKVSGTLKDMTIIFTEGQEQEIPIDDHEITAQDMDFMNTFMETCNEKFGEEFVSNIDLPYWMTNVSKHKEDLLPIVENVDKDTLIRSANFADYLLIYPLLAFTTFILSERCQDMKLAEMRTFLNEEDDFDEEQKAIIESCPEFKDL